MNLRGKIKYLVNLIQFYNNWYVILFDRFIGIIPRKVNLRCGIELKGGQKSLVADIVDEVFIRRVYTPNFLKIKKRDVVLDIGANIGVFSVYAAQQGASKIYSVEPLAGNISLINDNFRINGFTKPVIIRKAITDNNGKVKLFLGDSDSHGLLFGHNHERQFRDYVFVRSMTLKSLIKKYNLSNINYLKIDCEGSEGQIILSTPKDIWKIVEKIAIEYHNDVSVLKHTEIVSKLKEFGFNTRTKQNDKLFGYIYAWKPSLKKESGAAT